MKIYKVILLPVCMALMSGCSLGVIQSEAEEGAALGVSGEAMQDTSQTSETEETASDSAADTSDMFTDRDYEIGYDESTSAVITLEGSSARCDSEAVQISESTVTITDEGTYILSGTLDSGMIIVDAEDTDKVQIVLNGACVSSDCSAALYVIAADKVFVTTAADTENSLISAGEYIAIDDNNIDGAVFSKSDITFNGSGMLVVSSSFGHGIVGKDDVVFTSGSYEIISESHGISGKDSVRIAGGSFDITSGKDGIHSENDEDTSLGFLYIANGTFNITAQGDGLSAGSYLLVEDGTYAILSGDGSTSEEIQKETVDVSSDENSISTKGIKAAGTLTINGGTFEIDSADDGVHSNESVVIGGGTYSIATGDDGVHADGDVTMTAGEITISESYEGMEGVAINISGGFVDITSSDDGLNAAGGSDQSGYEGFGGGFRGQDNFTADSEASINISGGQIYVNASGDGIDSNGSLTVSGGEVYISGPDNGGNGALDYNGDAVITGGIVVATGTSQMAQNFGSSSTQGSMLVAVAAQDTETAVSLCDESGETIISWTPQKAYDCVLISCSEVTEGDVYTLITGNTETEVTMSSLIYSSLSGNMPGGKMGDKMNTAPGDEMKSPPGGGDNMP